jgi:hypothetical protein
MTQVSTMNSTFHCFDRARIRAMKAGIAASMIALFGAVSNAQEVVYDFVGATSGDYQGSALASVGDFDGDGRPEFAVGSMRVAAPWVQSGRVRVHSGATGTLLLEVSGPLANAQFGAAIAAMGDLDLDGVPDMAVGMLTWGTSSSFQPGAVSFISGASGATLRMVTGTSHMEFFGSRLAAIGDVNGDGVADLAIGAKRYSDTLSLQGRVRVVSGVDGATLYTLVGTSNLQSLGSAVAAVGDADGDGVSDFAIGAEGDSGGGDRAGLVRVVRGQDGTTIWERRGNQPIMALGSTAAGAGDVDGDGRPDVLAGAPFFSTNTTELGLVRLYSGLDGSLLREWIGTGPITRFGVGLAGGQDTDLDGVPDVLIGSNASFDGPGRVLVMSASTGALIYGPVGQTNHDELGTALAWLGDLDGDGRAEFGGGAPLDSTNGNAAGRARVWKSCSPPVAYCTAKANSLGCLPAMTTSGNPSFAGPDNFVVSAQLVINQSLGLLIWARQPNATPFGGGTLCLLPPLHRTPISNAGGSPPGVRDCTGAISFQFSHAYASVHGFVPGDRVYCQVWARDVLAPDGTGLSLSNALEFRWCP